MLIATNRLESPAMRDSYPVTAITTMFGSTVTPMVAGSFSEQRLMKSWTDLSHAVHVNLQGYDRVFSRHQNTVSGARASYAFDQSWHNSHGTCEGFLRAEAHTHFTHHSFFQTDFSSKKLWFIDLIQTSDCRSQNLAKFALCRKNLRKEDNYPPRRFKRHVEPESDDCERWFTGGFPMNNWCSFDAMTVRKRTISSLLSDLLSPISELWNDVFHANKSP